MDFQFFSGHSVATFFYNGAAINLKMLCGPHVRNLWEYKHWMMDSNYLLQNKPSIKN